MRRPFEIAAYDNTKNFSLRYYFELNPFYGDLREARGSALEARANLLALDWITHNTFWNCRVCVYTFVGQPFLKQL